MRRAGVGGAVQEGLPRAHYREGDAGRAGRSDRRGMRGVCVRRRIGGHCEGAQREGRGGWDTGRRRHIPMKLDRHIGLENDELALIN